MGPFLQGKPVQWVASRGTCLISPRASKPAGLQVSEMLNVVSSKARGEASMSAKNGSIKLVAGNSNPALAQAIAEGLEYAADQGQRPPLPRRRGDGRGPRKRPRRRSLCHPVDLLSRQRPPDGAAADARTRCAARPPQPHHRRHSLLRLLPPGSQSGSARADQRQAGRRSDYARRRRPRASPSIFTPAKSRASSISRSTTSLRRRCWCARCRSASHRADGRSCRPIGGVVRARGLAKRVGCDRSRSSTRPWARRMK